MEELVTSGLLESSGRKFESCLSDNKGRVLGTGESPKLASLGSIPRLPAMPAYIVKEANQPVKLVGFPLDRSITYSWHNTPSGVSLHREMSAPIFSGGLF